MCWRERRPTCASCCPEDGLWAAYTKTGFRHFSLPSWNILSYSPAASNAGPWRAQGHESLVLCVRSREQVSVFQGSFGGKTCAWPCLTQRSYMAQKYIYKYSSPLDLGPQASRYGGLRVPREQEWEFKASLTRLRNPTISPLPYFIGQSKSQPSPDSRKS